MENKRIFQLIDLDRTIFDTSLFVELICDMVDEYKPGMADVIKYRFEESARTEETFFALEFIREQLGREAYAALVEDAVNYVNKDELLLPGAKERLVLADQLATTTPGYGLLTFSHQPEDQLFKTRLISLDHLPIFISDSPDKAQLLTSWKTPEGKFSLPKEFGSQVVDELTLEDDKLRAFIELPEGVTGLWLTHREDAVQRLAEAATSNVIIIRSLSESAEPLKQVFS